MGIILGVLARCVATLAIALPTIVRADVPTLPYDPEIDLTVTAGAAAIALGLSSPWLAPSGCRVCVPDALDARARDALRWRSPAPARLASDLIASGILPLGAALVSLLPAGPQGRLSSAAVDLLIVGEAAAVAAVPNGIAKDAVARRRPDGGNRSFYSGHTSLAFSIAAATGTVSTMHGRPYAPWVWAGGMSLAAGVAYLRVAGDAHWLTDVAGGAAVGGILGFAVPWLLHRPSRPAGRWTAVPAPGGVALLF